MPSIESVRKRLNKKDKSIRDIIILSFLFFSSYKWKEIITHDGFENLKKSVKNKDIDLYNQAIQFWNTQYMPLAALYDIYRIYVIKNAQLSITYLLLTLEENQSIPTYYTALKEQSKISPPLFLELYEDYLKWVTFSHVLKMLSQKLQIELIDSGEEVYTTITRYNKTLSILRNKFGVMTFTKDKDTSTSKILGKLNFQLHSKIPLIHPDIPYFLSILPTLNSKLFTTEPVYQSFTNWMHTFSFPSIVYMQIYQNKHLTNVITSI